MRSKYLTEDGSIDTDRLLKMGLKPSEVNAVMCKTLHTSRPCPNFSWRGYEKEPKA